MKRLAALATVLALGGLGAVAPAAAQPSTRSTAGQAVSPGKIRTDGLSSGAKAWFLGPDTQSGRTRAGTSRVAFGSNVDANDPRADLAAGQSETAIAASGGTVLAAWNDATGFLVQPATDRRASLTGVAVSTDGAHSFTDLQGLPNNRPNQQWFGDPTAVAIDNRHFVIGSLYLPSNGFDCANGPARFQLAVSVATVGAAGGATFTRPIVTADGGDFCKLINGGKPPSNLAFLDKEWLGYDPASRTLVMSYTRFFFGFGGQSGQGQVEITRAKVPANPSQLASRNFGAPITVWPEEPRVENEGAYVSVARGGDAYVAWERNWITNLFNGNPFVYEHVALVPRGAFAPTVGGPAYPRIVTLGQANSNGLGGVRSLDSVAISGYNRGLGNDFPRIAVDQPAGKVLVAWNDATRHPLGDIYLRALPMNLNITGPIRKVNDDNSYALHFLPAVSVRGDGSVATSWYDRRIGGANSTRTDYFGEISAPSSGNVPDFRITTGSTDWNATSSLITPNFGDYTDNASSGAVTYYLWSDGRLGVPQPFADRRPAG